MLLPPDVHEETEPVPAELEEVAEQRKSGDAGLRGDEHGRDVSGGHAQNNASASSHSLLALPGRAATGSRSPRKAACGGKGSGALGVQDAARCSHLRYGVFSRVQMPELSIPAHFIGVQTQLLPRMSHSLEQAC